MRPERNACSVAFVTTQTQSMHNTRYPFGADGYDTINIAPTPSSAEEIVAWLGVEVGYNRQTTRMLVIGARAVDAVTELIRVGWRRSSPHQETISDGRIGAHMYLTPMSSTVRRYVAQAAGLVQGDDRQARDLRRRLNLDARTDWRVALRSAQSLADGDVKHLIAQAIETDNRECNARAEQWMIDAVA